MSILSALNEEQLKICRSINGPVLILAGAGSGKTRVLTHRIAHLILDHRVYARKILAVTFTNKAASEMKKRIEKLLNQTADDLWIGTFHRIFARILRIEGKHLGYNSNFSIYDTQDSLQVVKSIIKSLDLDSKQHPAKMYFNKISKWKDKAIACEALSAFQSAAISDSERFSQVYSMYENALKSNNAFDFNDLIVKAIDLFKQRPEILEKYQNQFEYILVDEYQDTNKAQYQLIHMLANKHHNLTVVGDEDQSIYKWRGADIQNILNFESDFPNATVFRLEQNYRSTKTILTAANDVVKHNNERLGKNLWTDNTDGESITLLECESDRNEASEVLSKMNDFRKEHKLDFNDCVVLYRTNAQSRLFEETLRIRGISYQIIGGLKFYDRKEIKDIIAYLRVFVNPSDSISLERIINIPARGIGATTIGKLRAYAHQRNLSLFNSLSEIDKINISAGIKTKLQNFKKFMDNFVDEANNLSADEILKMLWEESGLRTKYEQDDSPEGKSRLENVQELQRSVYQFVLDNEKNSLRDFLEDVQLLSDIDKYNESDDKVTLMTVHSAKGLEFPIVAIAGLEEGLFPHENAYLENGIEEERRLFYVGITRAERKLILSWARNRVRGYGNFQVNIRSQFLGAIPSSSMEVINLQSYRYQSDIFDDDSNSSSSKTSKTNYDEFDQSAELRIGMLVEHDTFGKGKILSISGRGENAKITIMFENNTTRKLVAKYANLTPVEFFDT